MLLGEQIFEKSFGWGVFPVAKTCRFRFPLKELRREMRPDLALPVVFPR
jgi:hypothetical protein